MHPDKQKVLTLIKLLKVNEITVPIGHTNLGDLGFKITKEGAEVFVLDSVPVAHGLSEALGRVIWAK